MTKHNTIPYVLAICTIALISCQGDSSKEKISQFSEKYGGVFAYNESGTVNSIFPASAFYQSETQIVGNIVEPLVKMKNDMSLEPCIAESWEISEDGKVYTFKIREGVFFHDDPCFEDDKGRELTAKDVAFCLSKACENIEKNAISHYLRGIILGADAYFNEDNEVVEGIEIVSDFELKIILENPYSEFIPVLSNPALGIYPEEYYNMYEDNLGSHLVGTGPFEISKFEEENILILQKNNRYWKENDSGETLPYLSGVKITFEKDKKDEVSAFSNSNLNLITDIPQRNRSIRNNEKGDFKIVKSPIMGTKFLGLFMPNETLKNKQLRKAIQYAIDRNYIVDSLLGQVGIPANSGVVPPIFSDYQSEPEIGYKFNPKSSIHSLELSGFSSSDLKELSIMTTNRESDILLADKIKEMLKTNLGMDLSVKYYHPDEYYTLLEKGKGSLFIDGYFGDYPSPENFLYTLFYGKFVPESLDEYPGYNIYRYKNPFYDTQLDSARYSRSQFERKVYFQKAERMLMLDAAIVPLYYFESEYALSKNVEGFMINPLKKFELTEVYLSN